MNRKNVIKRITSLNLDPVIILSLVLVFAGFLTYVMDSGKFEKSGKEIIPGSYSILEKDTSLSNLVGIHDTSSQATPASIMDIFVSIPEAIDKRSGMIFMVLFIGGMFGVLKKSGALESGLERLLSKTKGNLYIIIPVMMVVFSMGSTFIGLAKEYLIIVPMVVALTARLGLSNVIGLAIVAIPVKVGYLASITNPYALSIAQPLAGVPIFSGMEMRVFVYAVLLTIGIAYVLYSVKRANPHNLSNYEDLGFSDKKLALSESLILLSLGAGVAFLVYASQEWHWKYNQLSAYYLFLAIVFAVIARMSPQDTVNAFVDGMKKVLIAGVLIALATAVSIILTKSQVMDSIVNSLVGVVGDSNPYLSAVGMFFAQLFIDVVIPSTSGQAAVTMPILAPVGQLSGVDPHTTVLAFLMGNGATNIITPTSSGLLILLAAAQVGWGQWAKYILPFFLIVIVSALVFLGISLEYYS